MPPRRPTSRRRPRSSSDESEPQEPYPPSSHKRPRLSPTNENETTNDEAEQSEATVESDSSSQDSTQESAQPVSQRSHVQPALASGGYKPGAIKRIKVTNFVTYTSAEFFPGPKLNMVIGPNGTGKSTLVCAICLGLGWGPQVRHLVFGA